MSRDRAARFLRPLPLGVLRATARAEGDPALPALLAGAQANDERGDTVTQSLTTHNDSRALGFAIDETDSGGFGLAAEDLAPPKLSFNGKDGAFVNTVTGETTPGPIEVVPLIALQANRAYWGPFGSGEQRPRCTSRDTLIADDLDQAAAINAGPHCSVCPYSKWGEDGAKPLCTEYFNLAVASVEDEPTVYVFPAKRTQIRPLKDALRAIEMRRRKDRALGFSYTLELDRGDRVKDAKAGKDYWPLAVRVAGRVLPGRLAAYAQLRQMVAGIAVDFDIPDDDAAPPDDAPETSSLDDVAQVIAERDGRDFDEVRAEFEDEQTPLFDSDGLVREAARVDPADVRRGRR